MVALCWLDPTTQKFQSSIKTFIRDTQLGQWHVMGGGGTAGTVACEGGGGRGRQRSEFRAIIIYLSSSKPGRIHSGTLSQKKGGMVIHTVIPALRKQRHEDRQFMVSKLHKETLFKSKTKEPYHPLLPHPQPCGSGRGAGEVSQQVSTCLPAAWVQSPGFKIVGGTASCLLTSTCLLWDLCTHTHTHKYGSIPKKSKVWKI